MIVTMNRQPKIFLLVISVLIFAQLLAGVIAFILTSTSLKKLRAGDFVGASSTAHSALLIVRTLSLITLYQIPDLEVVREALTLLSQSNEMVTQLQSVSTQFLPSPNEELPITSTDIKEILANGDIVHSRLKKMTQHCQRSWFLSEKMCTDIQYADQLTGDVVTVAKWIYEEDPRLIVLFQNTEELRASGGFMGSYAKVQFDNGTVTELIIEDIYEPDGQFTGYVEPPAGVKEYLSSGKGMRLPDANWQVDFPSAAQTILNYFALGREQSIDGAVAVNSDLVEKLLTLTGDIYLPDYGMTVTSENFTTLARADRDQFFPGSQQKTNFLGHFFKVFKIKLTQLNPDQQRQLIIILRESLADKTIQLYSGNEDIQKIWTNYRVGGTLESPDQTSPFVYLVESNVGINKANRDISRSVQLNVQPTQLTVSVDFDNQNADLGYVNYQRVIVPADWSINSEATEQSVWVNENRIGKVDEELITNANGQQFKQVGWLVTVPADSSTTTEIAFTTSLSAAGNTSLAILKQPGLPATPYTVTMEDKVESFVLDQDTVIKMSN